MRSSVFSVLSALLFVTVATASPVHPAVARVISSEPVQINGIAIPARNFTPVNIGGDVATGSTSALIQFPDGTSVTLQPHSQARIGGKAGNIQVSVVRGSAQYNLTPASRVHVVNPTGDGKRGLYDDPLVPVTTASLIDSLGSRNTSLASMTPLPTTGYASAPLSEGTFQVHAGTGGTTSTQIVTPSGLIINLTPQTNPTTGAVTYTVASINQTVTLPNGTTAVVQVTTGPLVGATVGGIASSTTSGSTVAITLTPAGSTVALTPTQAATAVTTSVTTAVQTAVASGQLPQGTTAPTASPVSTGTFSSTAP